MLCYQHVSLASKYYWYSKQIISKLLWNDYLLLSFGKSTILKYPWKLLEILSYINYVWFILCLVNIKRYHNKLQFQVLCLFLPNSSFIRTVQQGRRCLNKIDSCSHIFISRVNPLWPASYFHVNKCDYFSWKTETSIRTLFSIPLKTITLYLT